MSKKRINRVLAATLALVMSLSLAACSTPSDDETTKAPEQTQGEQTTAGEEFSAEESSAEQEKPLYPIVEEPITIKGLIVGGTKSETMPNDRKIWQTVGNLTNIRIEWEVLDVEALNTRLAGGDWPDIIQCNLSSSIVNDYGVIGGRFLNLNDYLEYMPHLVKAYEDYPQLKLATTETNGEIYRMASISVSATNTGVRPHVNMEVLKNAGIDKKPETIDEFYQALVTLKEKNGEASFIPYIGEKGDRSYWSKMLFAAFGPMVDINWEADASDTVVFSRATEQMKRYWTFMNKLYEEGLIHQETATLDTKVRLDLEMNSKKVAFLDVASGNMNAEHFDSGEIEMEVCIPFTSEYDDTRTVVKSNVVTMDSSMFINAKTKYAVEICKMLDIMYAAEEVAEETGLYGQAFCYGPEGVTWVKNDDGKTYTFITPEGYASGAAYANAEWIWGVLGRMDGLEGLIPDTPGNNSTVRQEAYVNDVFPYSEKYEFPTSMLKFTEDEMYIIENKLADIEKYYKEMEVKFITGLEDIETGWNTYLENLNKMGLQEVVKVYQDAYDRWLGK